MSDDLFRIETGHKLASNETMRDALGRECWAFHFAANPGVRTNGPEIWVKRLTNGNMSREPSSFNASFFPDYTFEAPPAK